MIDLAIDHLAQASTALLHALSKIINEDDNDEKIYDPVTPMAAALRAVGMAEGILEAMKAQQE